jgi:hypothetical protein
MKQETFASPYLFQHNARKIRKATVCSFMSNHVYNRYQPYNTSHHHPFNSVIPLLSHIAMAAPTPPSYAFNPATDIPSQTGKAILITGANAGIGKQTALELAKHNPAQLWIAARNTSSGTAAVEKIKSIAKGVDVRCVECDLASFDSVKSAAKTILEEAKRLDILMLNAGIVCPPFPPSPSIYTKKKFSDTGDDRWAAHPA